MKKSEKIAAWVLSGILVLLVGIWLSLKQGWWIPLPGVQVEVYFMRPGPVQAQLVPVRRLAKGSKLEERLKTAIELVISGPSEEEKREGFYSAIPTETKLLDCRVDKEGMVFLDFSEDVEKGGGTQEMEERLAQIVFTATQFSEIRCVQLLIDGKTVKYFSGEGITEVEHPLTRADFTQFNQGGSR